MRRKIHRKHYRLDPQFEEGFWLPILKRLSVVLPICILLIILLVAVLHGT